MIPRGVPVLMACLFLLNGSVQADWPQFRGANASGVAADDAKLPDELEPEGAALRWKIALAKGHSSPVVVDGRIYLTARAGKRLLTLALNAADGKRLWERESPYEKLESVHRIGSHATSSVAVAHDRVVSFFGSSGLNCYSVDGELLWRRRMGPFNNQFGACSSPLIVGERVITIQDHDTGSFLAALDLKSGQEVWRVDRGNFRRNYGSPIIWDVAGRKQIIVAGTAHVAAYDFEKGDLTWQVRGLCRVVSNTPVLGAGRLLVASDGGGKTPPQPTFQQLLNSADGNSDRELQAAELPKSSIRSFFGQFDRDANGGLNEQEYESIRRIFSISRSNALAIRGGGRGDVTDSHVEWTYARSIPRNASPVFFEGHLYMIKDGGVMTSLDAATGEVVKQGRVGGGKYFSSPVIGDGKLYVVNDRGKLSVLTARPQWKRISQSDFKQDVYATPAISRGRIYVRTVSGLYCFGTAR